VQWHSVMVLHTLRCLGLHATRTKKERVNTLSLYEHTPYLESRVLTFAKAYVSAIKSSQSLVKNKS